MRFNNIVAVFTTLRATALALQAPQVTLASGVSVVGRVASNGAVDQYMGIPFAEPPVNNLRFELPKAWQGNGTVQAVQQICRSCRGSTDMMSGASISEDCLYLNVWASNKNTSEKKAVMVFVHGGGFSTGGTWLVNGTTLAQTQDVIVVAVPYRVGILGFPDAPGTEKNLGLLDLRLAVEWVRDNIEKFGGDVKRILLFGQSAGSMACDMYSSAWKDDPIVSAILGESGTAIMENFNVQYNGKYWQKVATKLGCGSGPASVSCVKTKSEMEVYNAIPMGGFPFPYFAPTVDNKTLWSISDSEARGKQGLFAKVPYVYGVNIKEFGLTSSDNRFFGCPANKQAGIRAAAGAQVWRYQFYKTFGPFGHGSEMPYVFGALHNDLSSYMMNAWASFAKNGSQGLENLAWPKYGPNNSVVRLGYQSEAKASFVQAEELDLGCSS